MSSAINTAIYARLAGVEVLTGKWLAAQQLIASTLGTDADTALPNVFQGNMNDAPSVKDANGVLKPIITYRRSAGLPNRAFAHGTAVDDGIYDFEVWSWYRTANSISDVTQAIDRLFDRRMGCPALPVSSGSVAWSDPFLLWNTLYDESRNGWIGLGRYAFVEVRE